MVAFYVLTINSFLQKKIGYTSRNVTKGKKNKQTRHMRKGKRYILMKREILTNGFPYKVLNKSVDVKQDR